MFFITSKFQMILGIAIAIVVFLSNTNFVLRAPAVLNFEGLKCPFCFGETFCSLVDRLQVRLTPLDYVLFEHDEKAVLFGKFENTNVAIKKLATSEERFQLEGLISKLFDDQFDYYKYKFEEEARRFYYESLLMLNHSFHDPSYKLKWCPTLTGVVKFFDPIIKWNFYDTVAINIWTSLVLNPEPLILQVFKAENGWPVPKYYGSCGQLIFVEDCGKSIHNYRDHPWLLRVHIAEELLRIAHTFTFKNPEIGIYLRDLSYDNVALDSELKVKVVDLEHVILVDKTITEDMPSTWQSEHVSEHFECKDCVTYSPMIICSHHISDHNIYAVCKEFFDSENSNDFGLLHSLPNDTKHDEKIRQIKYYAEECVLPSQNQSRFEISKKLLDLLSELKIEGNFNAKEIKKLI